MQMTMLNDSYLLNLPTVNKMDQLAAPKQRWLSDIRKKRITSRNWHGDITITFRCPLKNKQLPKRFLYFRPKLAAQQGSSAGTVLDPLLDHIGNVQNWTAETVQFLIQL